MGGTTASQRVTRIKSQFGEILPEENHSGLFVRFLDMAINYDTELAETIKHATIIDVEVIWSDEA